MGEYKYQTGQVVYSIDVNNLLIVKIIRGIVQSKWKSSDNENAYDVRPLKEKIIRTHEIFKTDFDNSYEEHLYRDECKINKTVSMSASDKSLFGELSLLTIKKAVNDRKRSYKRFLNSRPLCFFTGKPINYVEDVMPMLVMDGPAMYKPEGVTNIVYNKWPRSFYVNSDIYEVIVSSGSYKNGDHHTETYELLLEGRNFRKLEEVPNHRKIIAFNYINSNGRYYPEDVVEIDEEKDYFVEFYMPENGTIKVSDVCAVTKLAKTKDYLYIKSIKFLKDSDDKLVKFYTRNEKNGKQIAETIFSSLKGGAKLNLSGVGTVTTQNRLTAVNKDFKVIGLFLGKNSSYNF